MTDIPAPAELSEQEARDQQFVDLIAAARDAVAGRPELESALNRLERVQDSDLVHHPEAFEHIHQTLRTVLANAGDEPDTLPTDDA